MLIWAKLRVKRFLHGEDQQMNISPRLPAQRRLYRAFLSHAHTDRDFVMRLYRWSQEAKLPIWYDTQNLSASATISTELANAISQCHSMIIILSKSSIKSGWVEEEYNFAIGQRAKYKQYRIIPICIEECEIPGFLQTTKWIDAVGKKIDISIMSELLAGLYYDNKALSLENVEDIFVSRPWRPTEAFLADYICKMLDKAGFRLIGDSEDQGKYRGERVKNIIKSCGGLVAILPNRDGITSNYILEEINIAKEINIPSLVISEPNLMVRSFSRWKLRIIRQLRIDDRRKA